MRWALLDLATEDARAVLSVARRRKFAKGEVVFHEGDPGDTMHLIDKGHVAVRGSTPLGEVATLRILGPGEYFGELAVISPGPRSGTVVALDAVETMSLHRDQVEELRARHPHVDRVLMDVLITDVRNLSEQLLAALYLPVPKRVARGLVDLASKWDAGAAIPLTQNDLAELCGTTRPTANRIVADLETRGLISVGRGRVTVTDLDGLTRFGA